MSNTDNSTEFLNITSLVDSAMYLLLDETLTTGERNTILKLVDKYMSVRAGTSELFESDLFEGKK